MFCTRVEIKILKTQYQVPWRLRHWNWSTSELPLSLKVSFFLLEKVMACEVGRRAHSSLQKSLSRSESGIQRTVHRRWKPSATHYIWTALLLAGRRASWGKSLHFQSQIIDQSRPWTMVALDGTGCIANLWWEAWLITKLSRENSFPFRLISTGQSSCSKIATLRLFFWFIYFFNF